MYKLGIDAGAFSVQVALLDDHNQIIYKEEGDHHKDVKRVASAMIERALTSLKQETVMVAACGSMSHLLNLDSQVIMSNQVAISSALSVFASKAASAIVLGAQKTMYIYKPDGLHYEIRKNSNCSAGTGAFFEEQASRLQIRLDDISSIVSEAQSVPNIAGRCSVFSKTDMIHRMQEGVPTADILLGLCYALVKNYKASILRNQIPQTPVYLASGVMKNQGVITALKDLLGLKEDDYILDDNASFLGALGAALKAEELGVLLSEQSLVQTILSPTVMEDNSGLLPLASFCQEDDQPEFNTVPYVEGEDTYLGIDVGSTSINLVLINKNHQVIYYSYVKTLGKPLDIVQVEIEKMHQALPTLKDYKIAVTGSGREYIGDKIGADLVINEITAQTEGALLSHPETDTIFEIGGQDSKYMACQKGKMIDFEMNKVCAAGTGAFLEEQIHKLGISMSEFTEKALASTHPCLLGNRCTVFIEGSVNQALAYGYLLEDVCAGLAYAIASNYLYRVVNRKRIGDVIAIQGGIAYNQAVVCAFRSVTGKAIKVSPYFSVTGALGCASLLIHHHQLAFNTEKNRALNQRLLERSEASYLKDYQKPSFDGKKKVVGIPRVIFLHKMFPLFNSLLTSLGFDVLISPLTDTEIVKKAQQYCTAETCFPIKLIYGHIAWLLEQKVDMIILPRLYTIKHEGSVARKDYACMYMQTSPLLMEQAFHFKERGVSLISPELSIQFGKKYMLGSILSMAPELGVSKVRMLPAAISAFSKLVAHTERLEAIGKESLEGDEPIFVLISRVYNIIDPILNMGIEEHLNAMGCRVIHLEHLEASVMHVEHDYPDLYWPFGQHILTGLKLVKAHKNMYPIYITNHGCGPDTAIQHFLQNEMQGREYLHLEVDEHTSKVGVITRLEAFLYSLQPQEASENKEVTYVTKTHSLENFERILIPEYGVYSDLIEKYIKKDLEKYTHQPIVERVQPLTTHKPFDYAMNKEYYSLLIMLEELRNTVEKGIKYVIVAPIDEGSEVFGQYALLCTQELKRLGYDVTLRPFFMEDIIKRDDYRDIYQDMIDMELKALNNNKDQKRFYVLGEPLSCYKTYIRENNLRTLNQVNVYTMPLSEVLLFHMKSIDRKHEYTSRLKEWEKIHDEVLKRSLGANLYSRIDDLEALAKGKLNFCIGDAGAYRFAKLLSLSKEHIDAAILMASGEENTAIILKQLFTGYRNEIEVPFIQLDLDYEHTATKEDFELL